MTRKAIRWFIIAICILLFLTCLYFYITTGISVTSGENGESVITNTNEAWTYYALGLMALIHIFLFCIPCIPDVCAPVLSGLSSLAYCISILKNANINAIFYLGTVISLAVLLHGLNGFKHDSGQAIREYKKYIKRLIDLADWIGEKRRYTIIVGKTRTIPTDTDNVTCTEYVHLQKVLRKFGKGSVFKKKSYARMLLIGNFGSGKSCALQEYALMQIKKKIIVPTEFPIYVRLMDFVNDLETKTFPDNKIHTIEQLCEIKKQFEQQRVLKWKDYRNTIRDLAIEGCLGKNPDEKEKIKQFFNRGNLDKKVLFLFDGFNEVIQSSIVNNKKEYAQCLFALLCDAAYEDRFILSTTTYSEALTNNIIQYKIDEDKHNHNGKSLIYVIKGVKKKINDIRDTQDKLFRSSVALYSLKNKQEKQREEQGKLKEQTKRRERYITPYTLLETYASEVYNDTLKSKIVSEKKKRKRIRKKLIKMVEGNLEQCNDPYSLLEVKSDTLRSTRLFRIRGDYLNQDKHCIISHALLFEFLLAYYARQRLHYCEQTDSEDTSSENTSSEKTNPKDILFTIFAGKEKNNIIRYPHIREAFVMLITDLFVNGSEEDKRDYFIQHLFSEMEDKNALQFLLLLSRIQNNIISIKEDANVNSFGLNYDAIKQSVREKIAESAIQVRFQIYKLFPDIQEEECTIECLAKESLGEKWTYVSLKRQIIGAYIQKNRAWPLINTHGLNVYFMQEYPAELLLLQRKIINLNKHRSPDEKEIEENSFFKDRIQGIRWTTTRYLIYLVLLAAQMVFFKDIDYVFYVKMLGLIMTVLSVYMWTKQLVKNEEYYGWALRDFSREEPIYEVLRSILNRNKDDAKDDAKDDDVTILVGDWLKNRPSIVFMLISIIFIVYMHQLLYGFKIPFVLSIICEVIICILIYRYNCFPRTTWRYLKELYNEGPEDYIFIKKIMIILFAIVFFIPVFVTLLETLYWTGIVEIIFAVVSLGLFVLIKKLFIKRAEGENKERNGVLSSTPVGMRIVSSVSLALLYCLPGLSLGIIHMCGEQYGVLSKPQSALLIVFFIAISIYVSLLYSSIARKYRGEREDENIIKKIWVKQGNQRVIIETLSRKNLMKYYKLLSCKGQIDVLNRISIEIKKGEYVLNKDIMSSLKKTAKTVQALDIVLDLECEE